MAKAIPIRGPKPSEDGYMLLAVIFMMVILLLSLAVAAPKIAKSIQRDREVETMHRGKQYIRAIQLYYRKFGSYPPSIDALVNSNNIRFLRKKYIDPMTGKDDWKPILFGQNKAPLAMGFFGQPLAGGAPIAGIGPSGTAGTGMGSTGMGSSFGSSFGGSSGSSFGSSSGGSSLFGSSNSGTDSTDNSGSTNSANASANGSSGASGSTGTDASGNSTSGSGTGTGSGTGSGTGTSSTGFMSGQTGQTFGGGGIIGVEPPLDKQSILVYKKKNKYNQWEFTYSPLMDMMQQAGGNTGAIGQPASGMSGASGTTGSSFGGSTFGGSSFGGSSFGDSGSGSSTGGSSATPTQPQPQQ